LKFRERTSLGPANALQDLLLTPAVAYWQAITVLQERDLSGETGALV